MKKALHRRLKKGISIVAACAIMATNFSPWLATAYAGEMPEEALYEGADEFYEAAPAVTETPEETQALSAASAEASYEVSAEPTETPDAAEPTEALATAEATEAPDENGIAEGVEVPDDVADEDAFDEEVETPDGQILENAPSVIFEQSTDEVRVTVVAGVGVFPEGTTMEVVPAEDEETISKVSETVEDEKTKVTGVKAVEVTFYNAEHEEIEPSGPVFVTLEDLTKIKEEGAQEAKEEETDEAQITEEAKAVHVTDEGECALMASASGEDIQNLPMEWEEDQAKESVKKIEELSEEATVAFIAETFSTYALVYTVDFFFEVDGRQYEKSIAGGDFISLRDLAESLGLRKSGDQEKSAAEAAESFVSEIEDASFTSPELARVVRADGDTTVGELRESLGLECVYSADLSEEKIRSIEDAKICAGDWLLLSLRPFDSSEILTVTMKNGEVFTILVKDEQIQKTVITESGDTYKVTVTYDDAAGFPEGADLEASEILQDQTDEFKQYAAGILEALGLEAGSSSDARISDLFKTIRLFDIKILDEKGQKLQPAQGSAVDVRIELTDVQESEDLKVVHFEDGKETGDLVECTTEETEDGQLVRFEAEGFSVYALVDAPEPHKPSAETVQSLEDLDENLDKAFYLSYKNMYFGNDLNNKRCLVETGNINSAAQWYFEKIDGQEGRYYMYTIKNGVRQYLKQYSASSNEVTLSATGGTALEITKAEDDKFYIKHADQNRWLQHSNGGGGIRFWTDKNNAENSQIRFTFADSVTMPEDYYGLDGKSYGIAYDSESLFCTGLMAQSQTAGTLDGQYMAKMDTQGYTENLFVPVDSDLTDWTFHYVEADKYYITAAVDGTEKYLTIQNGSVTLSDTPQTGSLIQITAGTGAYAGYYSFSSGGYNLTVSGEEGSRVFTSSQGSSRNSWLKLTEKSPLSEDDYLIYTAQKISVSDPIDQVILYTRVWNGSKYEFYAVDHDGTLIRCYDDGDVIKWVGNQYQTALWQVIDHTRTDDQGNEIPIGYYELQNTYSGKYIRPQMGDNTVLSNSEAYINLDGRYYQEEYTKIRCWDDTYYAYMGLKVDLENNRVVPCPSAQADDFYFARVKNSTIHLTEVDTVDNNEFGITMKMIDFNNTIVDKRDSVQTDYFGRDSNVPGLLSTDIKGDGYPVATHKGASLGSLFAGDTPVNHLFIQSVYDESGYFEYDSTKNFASLHGSQFEVYDQLGTIERPGNVATTRHGQFMPYNSLIDPATGEPWPYSDMYTNTTTVTGDPLSKDDPRYGEGLHEIPEKTADYFFGMEMSANFTQTPSGLDAWGHDIIFEFSGDDDFWFYVDGELVLDLGGVHSAMTGSVNFRTGIVTGRNGATKTLRQVFEDNYRSRNPGASAEEVNNYLNRFFEDGSTVFKDYSTHSMKIYYMERGAGASNLHMRFNLTAVKKGEVTLSKKVTGSNDVDYDLMEFPYKILYRTRDDVDPEGEHSVWNELTQNENDPAVTYQGSKRPVKFAAGYTPVGETEECNNVFFLKPGEIASINMPPDVVDYKIVECGVNMNIFKSVKANGQLLSDGEDSGRHNYETSAASIEERPEVQFENEVDPDSLRTLTISKALWDEQGFTVTGEGTDQEEKVGNKLYGYDDDETTFDYRIYMSSTESSVLGPASYKSYYVKDRDGCYCRWNAAAGRFESLPISEYTKLAEYISGLDDMERSSIVFETSGGGAVSKIPAGYVVEFRGLPVDSSFKVEERADEIPAGYSLIEYERDKGSYISETDNEGTIRANEDPHVLVHNKRGWGLTVKKEWSDKDFMESRDDIYFAVYVKDPETGGKSLLDGSVRKMTSRAASLYYYFDSLNENSSFEDYEVYEVKLTDPGTAEDGSITYSGIERIEEGGLLTIGGKPLHKEYQEGFTYQASYTKGEATGGNQNVQNVRVDTVTNTRTGIRLVKTDWNGSALPGAVFTLTDSEGAAVGADSFTSDADGLITIAYLDPETDYFLTETKAPGGFQKPSEPWKIRTGSDGNITVTGEAGSWTVTQAADAEMAVITMKNKGFSLQAYKAGESRDSRLGGAVFALYRQVDTVSGRVKDQYPMEGYEALTSDDEGLIPGITSGLPAGVYYLSEVAPPSGYKELEGDLVFTITGEGEVDIPSHVESADTSVVILNNLTDSYVSGWITSSESEGHKTYTITIPNELAGVPVRIIKIDQNGKALEGAQFSFTGEGISETGLVSSKEEGSDDALIYENPALLIGTYTLTETDPPAGFYPPEAPIIINVRNVQGSISVSASIGGTELDGSKVKFDSETGVWTIRITNRIGYELPSSGGLGTGLFTALGALLVLAAGLLLWRRRRAV